MRFVSIDIETTCLDPEVGQVLQVGAVIEDTINVKPLADLPRFSCIVEHPMYVGQPVALDMNNWILKILASLEKADKIERTAIRKAHRIVGPGMVAKTFKVWLNANGFMPNPESSTDQITIDPAGKNFATFDKKFLEKLPSWSTNIQFTQRIIDPAILYMDWKNDKHLPNLNKCITRAGLSGEVTHDAVQDALDVIRVIREATADYERLTYIH